MAQGPKTMGNVLFLKFLKNSEHNSIHNKFFKTFSCGKKCSFKITAKSVFRSPNIFLLIVPKRFASVLNSEGFNLFKWTHRLQFQHPCRKNSWPEVFFSCYENFWNCRIFFSICSWIFLNVTQKISKCLNGRIKCSSDVPVKNLWRNGRKCFAHIECFLNKMQKSYSQCPEKKKKEN